MYKVELFTKEEWDMMSEKVHFITFGEARSAVLNRHHFILGCAHNGQLGGYITCMEFDSRSVYIQYGGVFPDFLKTIHAMGGYKNLIGWLDERYDRATTYIENTNSSMLKMALKLGFVVTGTKVENGKTFVHLLNEFKHA